MAITTYSYIRCNRCKRRSYNDNDIRHRFCGACHKFHEGPGDYTLGSVDKAASPEELHLMANACALHLTQGELAIVVKAFLECNDELTHELAQHTERSFTPLDWAQAMLASARAALVMKEVENVLKLYYGEHLHENVRRVFGPDRNADFFDMMAKHVGLIDDADEWTQWVMRCIDVALEFDEKQRTRTKESTT